MRYCGNCGNPIPDGDECCSVCGFHFEAASPQAREESGLPVGSQTDIHFRNCHNCGAPLMPDDDFCTECGCRYGETIRQNSSPSQQPKKHWVPIFVIIVVLIILIVVGGLLWWYIAQSRETSGQKVVYLEPSTSSMIESPASASPSATPTPEISSGVTGEDSSLHQVSEQALADGDVQTAIRIYQYMLEEDESNDEVAEMLEQAKSDYQNNVISQANELIQQGRLEEARSALLEAKGILGDTQEIQLALNALENVQTTVPPVSSESSSQPESSQDFYILPESSQRALTYQDIAGLTPRELMLARNEIFARHGRIFNDPDIRTYFESQSWYHGVIEPESFTEDLLSQVEKENIAFIQQYENS